MSFLGAPHRSFDLHAISNWNEKQFQIIVILHINFIVHIVYLCRLCHYDNLEKTVSHREKERESIIIYKRTGAELNELVQYGSTERAHKLNSYLSDCRATRGILIQLDIIFFRRYLSEKTLPNKLYMYINMLFCIFVIFSFKFYYAVYESRLNDARRDQYITFRYNIINSFM